MVGRIKSRMRKEEASRTHTVRWSNGIGDQKNTAASRWKANEKSVVCLDVTWYLWESNPILLFQEVVVRLMEVDTLCYRITLRLFRTVSLFSVCCWFIIISSQLLPQPSAPTSPYSSISQLILNGHVAKSMNLTFYLNFLP